MVHDLGLNVVLDLSFRFLTRMLVFEGKRGRDAMGQSDLEVNLVDAWVDDAAREVENARLGVEELFRVFQLLLLVHDTSLITVLLRFSVVTNEAALLLALKVELDVGGLHLMVNLHVDLAGDSVAWLIERQLCLELNLSVLRVAPFVREKEHRERAEI